MSQSPIAIVRVQLGERSYSISVGSNLLGAAASYQELPRGSSAVIVSNETVGPLYAGRLAGALAGFYPKVEVVLLPRPRRFGKTLNLSMLRCFFETRDEDLSSLFQDLSIWQAGDAYRAHRECAWQCSVHRVPDCCSENP